MDPAEPVPGGSLAVELVWCPGPGRCEVVALNLPAGATVADAVRASGIVERHGLEPGALRVGVWSRVREPSFVLRDRDRVELYRPLTVDPKEARRQRYRRDRSRRARPPAP